MTLSHSFGGQIVLVAVIVVSSVAFYALIVKLAVNLCRSAKQGDRAVSPLQTRVCRDDYVCRFEQVKR